MNAITPILLASLVITAALAGCLARTVDPAPSASAAPPPAGAPAMTLGTRAPPDANGGRTPALPDGARAITIMGTYHDYPTGAGVGLACTSPECALYLPFGIQFNGTLTGEAQGIAHPSADDPSQPLESHFHKEPVLFSGAIDGCGSGTLSFVIDGYFKWGDPKGVYTNETIRYVPGSSSTGLANVIDVFASFDGDPYAWPHDVKLTGVVWCG